MIPPSQTRPSHPMRTAATLSFSLEGNRTYSIFYCPPSFFYYYVLFPHSLYLQYTKFRSCIPTFLQNKQPFPSLTQELEPKKSREFHPKTQNSGIIPCQMLPTQNWEFGKSAGSGSLVWPGFQIPCYTSRGPVS